MNHEKYEERLALVRTVLQSYGFEPSHVSPVEYDENCPFPYNNFIYKISLASPVSQDVFANAGPFTARSPPENMSDLIIRLSNPSAEGLNHENRVENEVAAMYLAREGLAGFKPDIVTTIPAVFAWQPAKPTTLGWILMEFKQGVGLDKVFPSLTDSQKRDVLGQVADIFSGIQRAPLPETLDSFGGITIRDDKLVHGQMTTLPGGPWKTYGDFWTTRLSSQLKHTEESSVIQGWKPNGVRERIDKLFATGIDSVLDDAGVNIPSRALIHGDFTMNNVLFDVEENRITGLVDFDFAYISHPCQEFLTSFGDIGGNSGGCHGPDPTEGRLVKAVLTGSFDADSLPAEAIDLWTVAKAWDSALAARETLRPSTIAGMSALARLGSLEALLCPFRLIHPVFLKKMTPEKISEQRVTAEKALVDCIEALGF